MSGGARACDRTRFERSWSTATAHTTGKSTLRYQLSACVRTLAPRLCLLGGGQTEWRRGMILTGMRFQIADNRGLNPREQDEQISRSACSLGMCVLAVGRDPVHYWRCVNRIGYGPQFLPNSAVQHAERTEPWSAGSCREAGPCCSTCFRYSVYDATSDWEHGMGHATGPATPAGHASFRAVRHGSLR